MTKNIAKFFWLLLAVLGFTCGIIGLLLPVVPQVPFFLLAIFSLSKVSPRFHAWITHTRLYQKYIVGMFDFMLKKKEQLEQLRQLNLYQRLFVKFAAVVTANIKD